MHLIIKSPENWIYLSIAHRKILEYGSKTVNFEYAPTTKQGKQKKAVVNFQEKYVNISVFIKNVTCTRNQKNV